MGNPQTCSEEGIEGEGEVEVRGKDGMIQGGKGEAIRG